MRGPMQHLARGVHVQPGMLPVMIHALDLESRVMSPFMGLAMMSLASRLEERDGRLMEGHDPTWTATVQASRSVLICVGMLRFQVHCYLDGEGNSRSSLLEETGPRAPGEKASWVLKG